MTVHVEVTEEDIANGQPFNCGKCPVALALSRAVPGCKPFVGFAYFRLDAGHGRLSRLPERVIRFIGRFDGRDLARPFSFDLEIPS